MFRVLSHIFKFMHEKSSADSSDLWIVLFVESGLSTNKLSHNCLYQDLSICLSLLAQMEETPESPGQKKLRLTKDRLERELRERTASRCRQLRDLSEGRQAATDIEDKSTQCSDTHLWMTVYLFCFLLVIANLLFYQWLLYNGRFKWN